MFAMKKHKWMVNKKEAKKGMWALMVCTDCRTRRVAQFGGQYYNTLVNRTNCDKIIVRKAVNRILRKPQTPENVSRTR